MKLISMTNFVIQEWEKDMYTDDFTKIVKNYAYFLKQPLKLEMFVPCDEDGNVLEDIIGNGMIHNYSEKVKQYEQAKDKVLFEGFDIYSNGDLHNAFVTFESSSLEIMNVENLITDFQYSFYLTPNAIKRIFGQACY